MFFYSILLCSVLMMIFLVAIILFLAFSSTSLYSEKGGSFECGFQVFSSSVCIFSIPFFLVSLMFLLFDVEILLISLFPLSGNIGGSSLLFVFIVIFLVFFSTVYEWHKGILSWI